jgi:hypothetical protein
MIVVCVQWQSEIMTVLQGDFEEELRRMSVDRPFDRPKLRDPLTTRESPSIGISALSPLILNSPRRAKQSRSSHGKPSSR